MTDTAHSDLIQLAQALQGLDSEKINPASEQLDTLTALNIATLMNAEDQKVTSAVEKVLPEIGRAIEAAATALRAGGRIIYIGAGTSGRLGVQDLSAINVNARDFVVGLAASGRTPYVLGAMQKALEVGAKTASISCNLKSPLAQLCDIPITPIVGPEILSGSTRLKSGTAQKQILNMISTGAMVRIGKCYGNRMVDLNASNKKLKARAINLVTDLANCPQNVAMAELEATGWNIKAAILKLTSDEQMDAKTAINRINECGGHLRRAITTSQK